MVSPTPALGSRLRLSVKKIGRGYYKGNRVGSTGAHTQYGAYIIDWRKAKNYNVPDLTGFSLTPFVTQEVLAKDHDPNEINDQSGRDTTSTDPSSQRSEADIQQKKADESELQRRLMKHMTAWRNQNPHEFDRWVRHQHDMRKQAEREQPENGAVAVEQTPIN